MLIMCREDCGTQLDASLLTLFCICAVKMDQLINMNSKGATPQEESAQSLVLTLGSRLTTTKAEKQFARLRVKFTYCGHYTYIEGQQDVPTFSWPEAATEDSATTAACELQTNYMPEGVMVIAVQSGTWMGHDWPEAKVKIRETSRTDYVMVYRGVAPELADLLIDQQRKCAAQGTSEPARSLFASTWNICKRSPNA